jgi:hypothetical protein
MLRTGMILCERCFGTGRAVLGLAILLAPVLSARPTRAADNDAVFVSQEVPRVMLQGQSYLATVTFRNTGTAEWSAAAGYRLGSQNPGDNVTWGYGRVDLSGNVAAGEEAVFAFEITAPATARGWSCATPCRCTPTV